MTSITTQCAIYHGYNILISPEECKGCGLCVESCPPEVNRKALAAGREFIDNYVRVGAVSQPDRFAY